MPDLSWSLGEIASWVGGTLHGDAALRVERVAIDTRSGVRGALFVAIRGERFDGRDFLPAARDGGAVAALVERIDPGAGLAQIGVASAVAGLQRLGLVRRRAFSGPVAAITGSSGKTTTRRILASMLGQRLATHQPERNFNNHVGVPLTLLALESRHQAAVLELGCSDFGEIATLAACTDPDVALVTNVGPAHLERLGDLDGVARAKGELFAALRPEAVAVINMADPRVAAMSSPARRRVLFGGPRGRDAALSEVQELGAGGQRLVLDLGGRRVEAVLPLLGRHNAENALAAAAAATALGLGPEEIARGMEAVTPEPGRMNLKRSRSGASIIDDTYNANPASMRAALAALAGIGGTGKRLAVLGDMLELGGESESAHLALGGQVAVAGVDFLVALGPLAALVDRGAREAGMPADRRTVAASHEEAAAIVERRAGAGDTVLVKGSRGMRMDRVVALLTGADA